MGDAAARLSPAGGLGLNTGLQSCHNLAWKLAAVVRGEASDVLLDSYEAERHTAALRTMDNTTDNAFEVFEIVQAGLRGDEDRVRDWWRRVVAPARGWVRILGSCTESGAFISDGTSLPRWLIQSMIISPPPVRAAAHPTSGSSAMRALDISILDLFDGTMVLLVGRQGEVWPEPDVWPEPAFGSLMRNHVHFLCEEFEGVYGISETGAVLVRPDG